MHNKLLLLPECFCGEAVSTAVVQHAEWSNMFCILQGFVLMRNEYEKQHSLLRHVRDGLSCCLLYNFTFGKRKIQWKFPPIPVVARSKAWVCSHSICNRGFESHQGHGCLFLVSVVHFQEKSLLRADHSSRGVLPSIGCLSVIAKPRKSMPWSGIGSKCRRRKIK